jgi:Flp pilus assembly protein TadB
LDWLLLAALVIMWAAFLLPLSSRRRSSPATSVDEFERRMEFLAHAEATGTSGRWIVTPRKGARFIGDAERRRARARDRRRRILVFLIEAIGVTALMGLVPPLRVFWYASVAFGALLLGYVWLLLSLKQRTAIERYETAMSPQDRAAAFAARHVLEARNGDAPHREPRPSAADADRVHVVVRPASELAG